MNKPADCPWCDGETVLIRNWFNNWSVKCQCGAKGPGHYKKARATADWNRVAKIVVEFKAENTRRQETIAQFLSKSEVAT